MHGNDVKHKHTRGFTGGYTTMESSHDRASWQAHSISNAKSKTSDILKGV